MQLTKSIEFRTLIGFIAAWGTTVVMAFVAGCLFCAFILATEYPIDLLKAAGSGSKDDFGIFLFVGIVAAAQAAIVALLATIFIALPLFLVSRKHQRSSLRLYFLAGLVIALVVAGILIPFQQAFYLLPAPSVYWFEVVTIILAGPVYTLTFWKVTFSKKEAGSES